MTQEPREAMAEASREMWSWSRTKLAETVRS